MSRRPSAPARRTTPRHGAHPATTRTRIDWRQAVIDRTDGSAIRGAGAPRLRGSQDPAPLEKARPGTSCRARTTAEAVTR
ncbi:hypothetical protein ACE1SV_62940 [Streptomyces sp. E-15]